MLPKKVPIEGIIKWKTPTNPANAKFKRSANLKVPIDMAMLKASIDSEIAIAMMTK